MGSGELLHVVAEYIRLIKSKSPHIKYGKYEINDSSILSFKTFSL